MEDYTGLIIFINIIVLIIVLVAVLWVYNDAREKLGEGAGCMWGIIVFLFPLIGIIIWLIYRSSITSERTVYSSSSAEQWRSQSTTTTAPRPAKKANWEKVVNTGNMINCEFCGQPIRPIVVRCPHCHEDRAEYVDQAFKNS